MFRLALAAVTLFIPFLADAYPYLDERAADNSGNASADAIRFVGWEKCNTEAQDGKAIIENAWNDMLAISNAVKGNIHFDKQAEIEFLSYYTKNTDWQVTLTNILENPTTWTVGGLLSWSITLRCDDFLRVLPECPEGTLKQDRAKCDSRCWRNTAPSGQPPVWKTNAIAYTTNSKGTMVGTINFCPGFFNLPKCSDALTKWSRSSTATERLNLNNYVCQGSALLHELFHIDANSERVAHTKIKHVYDRSITFQDPDLGMQVKRQAYGPYYTKIMAKWTQNVGFYVATNADSLALYSLAKWVTSKLPNNEYPLYPLSGSAVPNNPPSDRSLDINGTGVEFGDATALGTDLGVPASEAYAYLDTNVGPCSDADTDMTCNSTSNNPPEPLNNFSMPPSMQTVSKPPSMQTVSKPPSMQTVSKPPSRQTVSVPPSMQTASVPPSMQTASKPPSI